MEGCGRERGRGEGQGMWIVDSKGKGVDCWRRRGWSLLSRQVPVHMNSVIDCIVKLSDEQLGGLGYVDCGHKGKRQKLISMLICWWCYLKTNIAAGALIADDA